MIDLILKIVASITVISTVLLGLIVIKDRCSKK